MCPRRVNVRSSVLFPLLFSSLLGCIVLSVILFALSDVKSISFLLQRVSPSGASQLAFGREVVKVSAEDSVAATDPTCSFISCFDVYRCGFGLDYRIKVYIYPLSDYFAENGTLDLKISREFYEILDAISGSEYHTSDPSEACLFVPSIDLLNGKRVPPQVASRLLAQLPYWNNGTNHLVWTLFPSRGLQVGKAMLAGSGWRHSSFRRFHDLSVPLLIPDSHSAGTVTATAREFLVSAISTGVTSQMRSVLSDIARRHGDDFVLVEVCDLSSLSVCEASSQRRFSSADLLRRSVFCLIWHDGFLFEALKAGCIPVVMAEEMVLPFSEVLEWNLASLSIREHELGHLVARVRAMSAHRIAHFQEHVSYLFGQYLSSARTVALTALRILNERVFPFAARAHREWNFPRGWLQPAPPMFIPLSAGVLNGYTAVVLTFDRVDSLFNVLVNIAASPSLVKILVVWNNQLKPPPAAHQWPKLGKPLKVMQTPRNLLSNRFYPYDEIESEAVLSIDDDILMTADELEFGFHVWRQMPDRLVGFPPRMHCWDNASDQWRYDSEWRNDVSMVLTGAAFYHKYYHFLFQHGLPVDIRRWVDEHMNCEDIAFNFLVANSTRKAVVKVLPKKKFRCPQCLAPELSADYSHYLERSRCIDHFSRLYGSMPLSAAQFRVDPLLFKTDRLPDDMLAFPNIGTI